jgi:hypothetical protein
MASCIEVYIRLTHKFSTLFAKCDGLCTYNSTHCCSFWYYPGSPNDFSPNDYSPNDYSPNDYSPNNYSPNNYSPNDYSPNNFSPNGLLPKRLFPKWTFTQTTFPQNIPSIGLNGACLFRLFRLRVEAILGNSRLGKRRGTVAFCCICRDRRIICRQWKWFVKLIFFLAGEPTVKFWSRNWFFSRFFLFQFLCKSKSEKEP